jgi:peptidoglycan/LPS O-acetylase OafA/YrhL
MHGVVYVYLAKYIWPTFKASGGGDFFTFLIIVMVPCVILVSSLTYHFIEMPFIKFAARYVKAFKREC